MIDDASTAQTASPLRVAVLGIGTMGAGIATNLLKAGLQVSVWNRTRASAAALEGLGAEVASSPALAVAEADIVVTMVFDEAAVAQVAKEFVPHLRPEAIWVQSATVGVAGIKRLAALRAEHLVDAPVLGTKGPALAGTLTVLASGAQADIERARPVFEAIAAKTVNAGTEIGQASALKLACNTWIAALTAGTAQALEIGRVLGVAPEAFLAAIADTASDSAYAHTKGAAMLADTFDPQFAVDGLLKDVRLAQAETGELLAEGLLPALVDLYGRTSASGRGGQDVAAVIHAIRGS